MAEGWIGVRATPDPAEAAAEILGVVGRSDGSTWPGWTAGCGAGPARSTAAPSCCTGPRPRSATRTGERALELSAVHAPVPPAGRAERPAGRNGRLPAGELTGAGDGERMHVPAARAFHQMDAAATAAGRDLQVTSGYRTYAEQAALYRAYLNGTGNLAAPPGHSTHGLGLSADIQVTDPATLRWLRAHAKTYGFVNDVPGEAWHWTWRP